MDLVHQLDFVIVAIIVQEARLLAILQVLLEVYVQQATTAHQGQSLQFHAKQELIIPTLVSLQYQHAQFAQREDIAKEQA